jgi:hypothetical protein
LIDVSEVTPELSAQANDETAAVLAEALAGRRLGRRAARQLAATLRRVTGALPPGSGNLAGLSRRLDAAADVLDAQAGVTPRRRDV